MILYTNNSGAAFIDRICIPTDVGSGIDVVVNRWSTITRLAPVVEAAMQPHVEDERRVLWRALLTALCDWAARATVHADKADTLIMRAEQLGDRWRFFGFSYDMVVEQMRLMHIVLHDTFRTWTYDDSWLSAFECGYTVANLAAILGFAKQQLDRSGRWEQARTSRHAEWRRFLGVV